MFIEWEAIKLSKWAHLLRTGNVFVVIPVTMVSWMSPIFIVWGTWMFAFLTSSDKREAYQLFLAVQAALFFQMIICHCLILRTWHMYGWMHHIVHPVLHTSLCNTQTWPTVIFIFKLHRGGKVHWTLASLCVRCMWLMSTDAVSANWLQLLAANVCSYRWVSHYCDCWMQYSALYIVSICLYIMSCS